MNRFCIIGGGVMGETIINALIRAGVVSARAITVIEPAPARAQTLAQQYHINALSTYEHIPTTDVIILAVKPQDANTMCKMLQPHLKRNALIISIMAGVSLQKLCKLLQHKKCIRSMPNTPARVGYGMTVWVTTKQVTTSEKKIAKIIFEAFGDQLEVTKETLIDATTAVSGSGPAYVFGLVEYLVDAAQQLGFTHDQANHIVIQTLKGSTQLLLASTEDASELRKRVTSKGGTTEAAFRVFTTKKTAHIYRQALRAAYRRSQQLSGLS